jgi:hypothetical protein
VFSTTPPLGICSWVLFTYQSFKIGDRTFPRILRSNKSAPVMSILYIMHKHGLMGMSQCRSATWACTCVLDHDLPRTHYTKNKCQTGDGQRWSADWYRSGIKIRFLGTWFMFGYNCVPFMDTMGFLQCLVTPWVQSWLVESSALENISVSILVVLKFLVLPGNIGRLKKLRCTDKISSALFYWNMEGFVNFSSCIYVHR